MDDPIILGPSGRLDGFRPLALAPGMLASFPESERARLGSGSFVVGPSGQVWCLSGRCPELVGTWEPTAERVRPLPWALDPDERARLDGFPLAGLRALRSRVVADPVESAPSAPPSAPAAPAEFRPAEAPIGPPRAPEREFDGVGVTKRRTRGPGKKSRPPVVPWAGGTAEERAAEMARRRETGETFDAIGRAFGVSAGTVYQTIRSHQERLKRREAVA
ncbi:hypothetical protein [Urbifossiella limnaea]|uniref:Uncharacterized protein n=1 Tax=Urbifossiella limnaea TaxID=2528023 RepID=A0A517Y2N7_9BACT|nr:hypothetical protein [Urbifossiella limnaea]QDU24031.1 hypothetical protein ETAA1_60420 [Urbifossiella limnaea]